MTLLSLRGENFRNLPSFELKPSSGFNLIYGMNGSGKSSILEAIYYLGRGRSFRTQYPNRIIREGMEKFLINGVIADRNDLDVKAGIEKDANSPVKIHIAGSKANSSSELLNLLPLQLINPDSFRLIDSGPKHRRQFIDWGMFHMEHSFLPLWKKTERCLKQRNAALRAGLPDSHIKAWDEEYISASEDLAILRKSYVESLKIMFLEILEQFGEFPELSLGYYRGWKTDRDLADVLDDALPRDKILGYTQNGPHRSDLSLRINNTPASEILSRGEQKIVVAVLHLSQYKLLKNKTNISCACLVDDLSSELDEERKKSFLSLLSEFNSQVFLTGVDKSLLGLMPKQDCRVFSLNDGKLSLED